MSLAKRALVIIALITLEIVLSGSLQAQTASKVPSAETLISGALRTAKAENKGVILEFRADWCQWCARLDRAFQSAELSRLFANNYVIVRLTVQESEDKIALENPGADAILAEIGASKAGIPMIVFLNQDGEKIANSLVMPKGGNIGYPVTSEEITAFEGLLQKTAPRMSAAERATVVEWLTKNAPKDQ